MKKSSRRDLRDNVPVFVGYTEPPEMIAVLWHLRKNSCQVSAELWRHPHGFELRFFEDGERWAQVHPSRERAERLARRTRQRLRAQGFR